ncbi:MAG: ATP-binding protein [Magnetococcus sp. YQC-5]
MALISYDSPARPGIAFVVEQEDPSSKIRLCEEIRTLHQAAEITADLVIHQFEQTESILTKFRSTSTQLQAVLDAASQITIIATNLSGIITLFNRGAEWMLGWQASAVLGQLTPLEFHHPDDRVAMAELLATPETQQKGSTLESLLLRNDGSEIPVTLSITPLLGADHTRVGFLWVAMDISARKLAEEQLRRSNDELQRLDKLKSDLLSSVSHELRTPLTSIRGFAQLIRREFDRTFAASVEDEPKRRNKSQRIQDNLDIILTESERLTRLINEVLDLAKIESGRIEWHKTRFPLQEAIRQAVNAVQGQFAGLSDVTLEVALPEVPLLVELDKDRMVQVLVNLLNNAAKFITAGFVRVQAKWQTDGMVRVDVVDTGCGFPPEQAESIFDKFQQVHRDDTLVDKPQGTGLGLSICKEIVQHHGGRIWATSVPGEGSTFSLILPLLEIPVAPSVMQESSPMLLVDLSSDDTIPSASSALETRPLAVTDLAAPLVLVVEDDEHVRIYLNQLFQDEGYRVMLASEGQAGLELAEQHQPDLITLDLAMPVLDGRQTMMLLHQSPKLNRVPVIILSAMPDFDQVGGAMAMSKPIDEHRLLRSMRLLLRGRRQETESELMPCLLLNGPTPIPLYRLPEVIRLGEVTCCDQQELMQRVQEGFRGLVTIPTEMIAHVDGTFWERLSSLDVLILPDSGGESLEKREECP